LGPPRGGGNVRGGRRGGGGRPEGVRRAASATVTAGAGPGRAATHPPKRAGTRGNLRLSARRCVQSKDLYAATAGLRGSGLIRAAGAITRHRLRRYGACCCHGCQGPGGPQATIRITVTKESCKGLGSVSLKINNQHTLASSCQ